MSNYLDLDQDQHSVSPDLGPNCLQFRLLTTPTGNVWANKIVPGQTAPEEQSDLGLFVLLSARNLINLSMDSLVWYPHLFRLLK